MNTQSSENDPVSASNKAEDTAYVKPVKDDEEMVDVMETYVQDHHLLFDSGINNPVHFHRQEKQTEPEVICVPAKSVEKDGSVDQDQLGSRPQSRSIWKRWSKWLLLALIGVLILVIVIAILAAKDVIGDDDSDDSDDTRVVNENHGDLTFHDGESNGDGNEEDEADSLVEDVPRPYRARVHWQAIGTLYPGGELSYWTNFLEFNSFHGTGSDYATSSDDQEIVQYSYTIAESHGQSGLALLDVSFQSGCCSVNWSEVLAPYQVNSYGYWGPWSSIESCECNGLKMKSQVRAMYSPY